jgi:hypothetical protein
MASDEVKPGGANPQIYAEVSRFDRHEILGYAYDAKDQRRILSIELSYENVVVAKAIANRFDPTQFKQKIGGGLRAFKIEVPSFLRIARNGRVQMSTSEGHVVQGGPRTVSDLLGLGFEGRFAIDASGLFVDLYHGGFVNV